VSTDVCQFCPKAERVPAVRSYTDPQGYVYRLCERHYRPIEQAQRAKKGATK
jgi:hypothetical protein